MNQLILDLENKIKFNNKLLLETISNVFKLPTAEAMGFLTEPFISKW